MEQVPNERDKTFLEGYINHKDEPFKNWKKCWTVLRGNVVCLFPSNKANSENIITSLILKDDTVLRDLKSKKNFKLECSTVNSSGTTKTNIFKFNKESDYNIWKAYLIGISKGIIPNDVPLLPGQRSDLYEAIIEVQRQAGLIPRSTDDRMNGVSSAPPIQDAVFDEPLSSDDDENDPIIHQLKERRKQLAEKDMEETEIVSPLRRGSDLTLVEFPERNGSNHSSSFSSPSQVKTSHSSSTGLFERRTQGQHPLGQPTAVTSPNQRISFMFSSHPFYAAADGNLSREIPEWFVNCSREQAEQVLMSGKKFGTVLMRASSSFPITGSYVISYRRELKGKVMASHYNIVRSTEGFKIDVHNQHKDMPTLSDVMEFFLSVAGSTAKPLTCNDLTELLGKYQASAFPPVREEDQIDMRPGSNLSPTNSRDIPAFGQPPSPRVLTQTSSPSSSSQGSRTSALSFDLTPSNQHQPLHTLQSDRQSLTSSNLSTGARGTRVSSPKSSLGQSSPTYSGSVQDSVYNEAYPFSPDRLASSLFGLSTGVRGTRVSSPKSSLGQSSPTYSGSVQDSVYNEASPVSPDRIASSLFGPSTGVRGTGISPQKSSLSQSSSFSESFQESVYHEAVPVSANKFHAPSLNGGDRSLLRETSSVPTNLQVYTNESQNIPKMFVSSNHQVYEGRTNGMGRTNDVYNSQSESCNSRAGGTKVHNTPGSDVNSTSGNGTQLYNSSGSEVYSTGGNGTQLFNSQGSDVYSTRGNGTQLYNSQGSDVYSATRGFRKNSTSSADVNNFDDASVYNSRSPTQQVASGKRRPPPPPAKPSSPEIYQLMKPPPTAFSPPPPSPYEEVDAYTQQSDRISSSEQDHQSSPPSVKELAKMLLAFSGNQSK